MIKPLGQQGGHRAGMPLGTDQRRLISQPRMIANPLDNP
jgi:hypothetical protein